MRVCNADRFESTFDRKIKMQRSKFVSSSGLVIHRIGVNVVATPTLSSRRARCARNLYKLHAKHRWVAGETLRGKTGGSFGNGGAVRIDSLLRIYLVRSPWSALYFLRRRSPRKKLVCGERMRYRVNSVIEPLRGYRILTDVKVRIRSFRLDRITFIETAIESICHWHVKM